MCPLFSPTAIPLGAILNTPSFFYRPPYGCRGCRGLETEPGLPQAAATGFKANFRNRIADYHDASHMGHGSPLLPFLMRPVKHLHCLHAFSITGAITNQAAILSIPNTLRHW